MKEPDKTAIARRLDLAIEQILAVRLGLGLEDEQEPPFDAMDEALRLDDGVQDARRTVRGALDGIMAAEGGEARHAALLDLEAAVNDLAAKATMAGWRVGRVQTSRA